jgi:hypothetical protein
LATSWPFIKSIRLLKKVRASKFLISINELMEGARDELGTQARNEALPPTPEPNAVRLD